MLTHSLALIVPYFGRLPDYFPLFLQSCGSNPGVDWLIFTDDDTAYPYPGNVHWIRMSFSECRALVQSRFDFPIALAEPQKLCDYKPAYGYIFEEYLSGYEYWGHCDLDQIFGCLEHFLTDELLEQHDKLFSLGHLTVYRNDRENNRVFMSPLEGKLRYREVFTTEAGQCFDEWLPGNVNEIYLQTGRPAVYTNIGADLHCYQTQFRPVIYDVEQRCYRIDPIRNSIFLWEAGELYRLYPEGSRLCKTEYPYVHLQKRKMQGHNEVLQQDSFYIVPNRFVPGNAQPEQLLKQCEKYRILNYQYFKVKYQSLKKRIKTGNWKFDSVFR